MADVVVGGVRLNVQRLGPQPSQAVPVLFVHGLVMDNLASWYFTVANPVATSRPVILYDLRGHGRSERPAGGYDLSTLVEELHGVLRAQGIDGSVYLVGHSFGGLLALSAALARPQAIAGLVLVDALLPEPGWGQRMAQTLSLAGRERDELIADRFSDWLGRHSARKRNRLARQASALVEQTSLLADLGASIAHRDEALARLGAPTLALYGAESDVRGHGERLAAALGGCTLELLEGCTHSLMWERTDAVRDRIVAWLRERP